MDDLQFCLAHYRIIIVPDVLARKARPWYVRLFWCPWRAYDEQFVNAMPDGAIRFDHKNHSMLMNPRTAVLLRTPCIKKPGGTFLA